MSENLRYRHMMEYYQYLARRGRNEEAREALKKALALRGKNV